MKYSKEHADFLKENNIDSFVHGISRDKQLFMVQYDSVRTFEDGIIIPILPRIVRETFTIRQSKMNFKGWNQNFEKEQKEQKQKEFEEFKKNTYELKNN